MPIGFIRGMTDLFVRACVHDARFEDEEYLNLQINTIRAFLEMVKSVDGERKEGYDKATVDHFARFLHRGDHGTVYRFC